MKSLLTTVAFTFAASFAQASDAKCVSIIKSKCDNPKLEKCVALGTQTEEGGLQMERDTELESYPAPIREFSIEDAIDHLEASKKGSKCDNADELISDLKETSEDEA